MKKQKEKVSNEADLFLIEKIQPAGGISFKDESYIKTGNGYECCVHIYEFPSTATPGWLRAVSNIKDSVTQIDIATDNVNEVKKNINKSLKEQESRLYNSTNYSDKYDAQRRAVEMKTLYDEIDKMGEVVKLVSIRIFIADRSLINLEEKVKKLFEILESNNYKSAVYLNETQNEWMSMYQTYTKQQSLPYSVVGQSIITRALAIGNPFHFSSLEDPYGSYLGHTPCGGSVLFDEFTKTKNRLYYNALCVGTMGSGKSTLLKKRLVDRAARGDFVRTFDISGEFETITKTLGGKIIRMDGLHGLLNPLEILRAGDNEVTSFQRHMSKVTTIFKFLEPEATSQEITTFANLMRELYETWDLSPELEKKERQITGLPAASYPIFSDFLFFVVNKMKETASKDYNEVEIEVAKQSILIMNKIKNTIEYIVRTYGTIFDGHTSIDNIQDEQIVTFDLSQLKEMDPKIFDAQIFNMVSLCWDNCVTNGSIMYSMLQQGKIGLEDVVRFMIIIDESHRWINTSKIQALDMITLYLREGRKYFGGILLASQSIRDYVPEGSSEESINKIKTIFELTQYKFIFHQDNNVLGLIDDVFQNSLTSSQRARIPNLEVGDNILCISGERNLEFHVDISDEEKRLFTGGI